MIEFFGEGSKHGKLWDKFRSGKIECDSSQALDAFVAKSKAEAEVEALRILRVGNMQVPHVTREIKEADLDCTFGTQLFESRCKWATRYPVVFKKLCDALHSADKPVGFYLAGETRCGKSVFAKAYAFRLQELAGKDGLLDRQFVKFINFGKLMGALSANDYANSDFIMSELRKAKNLFVEDIGSEEVTSNEKRRNFLEDILFNFLDCRIHSAKTYFTSNLAIDALPYQPRLIERIREMSKEIVVGKLSRTVGPSGSRTTSSVLSNNPTYS